MTDRPTTSEPGEIDVDPYADADGRLGELFADEVGDGIAATFRDSSMWETPSTGLGDRIVDAVSSESGTGSSPANDTVEHRGAVVPMSRFRQLRPVVLGAAAAVVVLFGGIVLLSALSGSPASEDFAAEFVPTGELPDVSGEIEVTALQSGLRIELDAPSLPRRAGGDFYEGWLRLDDGRLVPVGTFHEGGDVTLWAGIELEKVTSMTITLEEAVAADSPEQASSGRVVLKVDFPKS